MAERNLNILINAKDNASKTLGGLSSALEKNKATIQKTTAVATAAFVGLTAAIGASVKSFANAGDQVQKMALRTGFSTTALSELKHAAELSGTSLEAIEKSVLKMGKTLLDASDESLIAQRAIERLGVSIDDLDKMSPEERFFSLAGAVAEVGDPTRRAAMAMEIFGKQGVNLLPMLAQGADGIEAMRKEAHTLGIVFDEDAANAAALFNDNMLRLNKQMEGVKNQIAMAFIPMLTQLAESLREPLERVMHWIQENPKLVKAIVMVVLALTGFVAVMGMLTLALMAFNPISLIVVGAIAGISLAVYAINNLLKMFGLTWGNVWEGIKTVTVAIADVIVSIVEGIINRIISGINAVIKAINAVMRAASNVPGFKGDSFQISEIKKVDFGGASMLQTGKLGGNTVNVSVNNMIGEKQYAETMGNNIIKSLQQNYKLG